MRPRFQHFAFVSLLLLAGCAGDIAQPTSIEALPPVQTGPTRIGNITADSDPGVLIGDNDYANIITLVKGDLQSQPQILLVNDGTGEIVGMHFTRFDRGNAFARFVLAGLGQIHIDATISVADSSGKKLGEYKVSKSFFFGGVYGATTNIEDVEVGFAKSVAAIFQTKNS